MLQRLRPSIPLGRPAPHVLGPAAAEDGLLLLGHGSRCPRSDAEMRAIAALVSAARPDLAVEVGYLEMADPPAHVAIQDLVARGARRVTVLPLMLLAAGHAKSDGPAVVLDAREHHPTVEIRYGRPLGVEHALVTIARHNLDAAGGLGLPLVVIARGSSDPDANADAHKATRLVAETTGAPWSLTGFSGVTGPLVPDLLELAGRLGSDRLALFSWYLCNGKLLERIRDDAAAFTRRRGIEVVDGGWFGPDPGLAPLVLDRLREVDEGRVAMSCDTCAYRLPYPGLEGRVGQPIGVGHSHLAHEHRVDGHSH